MIGNGESRMGHLLIWKIYYLDPEPKVKPADLENPKLRKASNGAKPARIFAPTQRHCTAGQPHQHGQGLRLFDPTRHPPYAGAMRLALGAGLPAGGAG